jgi:hypothetical protein
VRSQAGRRRDWHGLLAQEEVQQEGVQEAGLEMEEVQRQEEGHRCEEEHQEADDQGEGVRWHLEEGLWSEEAVQGAGDPEEDHEERT